MVLVAAAIIVGIIVVEPSPSDAQSEPSTISIRARGYSDDDAELIELEINGQVVETFSLRDGMETYTYPVNQSVTIDRLRINFINDADFGRRHPNNREVRINYVEIDAQRIQSDSNNTTALGVWSGSGDRCRAETSGVSNERLQCNGYFDYGDAIGISITGTSTPSSGVFYVSTSGDDDNSGTSANQAFATITHAVATAPANSRILVQSGTYREGEIRLEKPVTLEATGQGEVWLKGSQNVSNGWRRSNGAWYRNGWTQDFCRGVAGSCSSYPIDYGRNPYSFHADMLFMDGTPLVEVGSVNELSSAAYDRAGFVGRFYVDQSTDRIYTNRDPRNRLVESAKWTYGLKITVNASGSTVDGINVTHMASSSKWATNENAAVYVTGDDVTIKNARIEHNASYGLFLNPYTPAGNVDGSGYVIENNSISWNGQNGAAVRAISDSRFVNNAFDDNNAERWNIDTSSAPQTDGTINSSTIAGIKISGHSTDLVFDGNSFNDNYAHGWWCDVGCSNVTFINNVAANNKSSGVFYEISSHGIIANNILSKNGSGGLWLFESNDVTVYNNVIEDNHLSNVWFFEGRRHDAASLGFNNTTADMAQFASHNVTFALDNIDFGNNIISSDNANGTYNVGNNKGKAVWWSDVFRAQNTGDNSASSDHDTEGFNAKFTYFDCNPTFRSDSAKPRTLIEWYGAGETGSAPPRKYNTNFSQFNTGSANQFQSNALLVQDQSTNPFYTLNRSTWNFRHVDAAQLSGCKVTPANVTAALGVSPGLNTAGLVDRD